MKWGCGNEEKQAEGRREAKHVRFIGDKRFCWQPWGLNQATMCSPFLRRQPAHVYIIQAVGPGNKLWGLGISYKSVTLSVPWKARSANIHRVLYLLHGQRIRTLNRHARECSLLPNPLDYPCDGKVKRVQDVPIVELSLSLFPWHD